MNIMETQEAIETVTANMCALLKHKNENYGDSALNPTRIFSKSDASAGILIRLDDKMSRIMNSDELRQNDVWDVMGYLILLSISNGWFDYDENENSTSKERKNED